MKRWKSKRYQEQMERLFEEEIVSRDFLENKTILITGATGLLGMALCDFFLFFMERNNVNASITLLVRNKAEAFHLFEEHIRTGKFHFLEQDLSEPLIYDEEWDYILHGAGNNHPVLFSEKPVETMKVSLLGTISLLEHSLLQKVKTVKKFVFFSTGEVYGEQMYQHKNGCEENLPGILDSMALRSCYPESKRACETLCISYYHEYNLPVVIARLGYVYGPTMQKNSSKADIQFFRNALEGKNVVLKSTGDQERSYLYLMDALAGILILLCRGSNGEAYNIANPDSNVKIRELAEEISKAARVDLSFQIPEEVERRGYSKLNSEILVAKKIINLGFCPRYLLQSGVEGTFYIAKEFWEDKDE